MAGQSIPERIRRLFSSQLDPRSGPPDRGPRAIKRLSDDPDRVDEAAAIMGLLGGDVWAGDVVEVESNDPAFWNARTFELTYRIECVCLAEVGDQTGRFSFTILFLAPDQGADVLIVEGDLPATARAYLGVRGPDALTDELRRLREDYRRSPDAQVTYPVETDGLGEWTAYAARENGRFWLRRGASHLVPQTAQADTGAPYRDCSFYYGPSLGEMGWALRLLEIGGFGHAFQLEVLPLSKIRFWRRDRPTGR